MSRPLLLTELHIGDEIVVKSIRTGEMEQCTIIGATEPRKPAVEKAYDNFAEYGRDHYQRFTLQRKYVSGLQRLFGTDTFTLDSVGYGWVWYPYPMTKQEEV